MSELQDVGNHCVHCGCDTAFRSGNFVNRIPADDGEKVGFMCADCQCVECDRCSQPTLEYWTGIGDNMIATGEAVCDDCLTPTESKIAWET
jgi:hypothetical protein